MSGTTVAGSDWPSTAAVPPFRPSPSAHVVARTGITCEVVEEKLTPRTRFSIGYETHHPTPYGGRLDGVHAGSVSVDRTTFAQSIAARSRFRMAWPEAEIAVRSTLGIEISADRYEVEVEVVAEEDGAEVATRRWRATYPRYSWQ